MLTQAILKNTLHYDETTGIFYRKDSGMVAGHPEKRDGHRRIRIRNIRYAAHRLAWMWVYGEFPNGNLDHINGNPDDNRIENLRIASVAENSRNAKTPFTNTSGVKGVYWHKGKKRWYASCRVNGKKIFIGTFKEIKEAEKVMVEFRNNHHKEFARHF